MHGASKAKLKSFYPQTFLLHACFLFVPKPEMSSADLQDLQSLDCCEKLGSTHINCAKRTICPIFNLNAI